MPDYVFLRIPERESTIERAYTSKLQNTFVDDLKTIMFKFLYIYLFSFFLYHKERVSYFKIRVNKWFMNTP
jgi:hypothetical protein